jgi:hypothetical protein
MTIRLHAARVCLTAALVCLGATAALAQPDDDRPRRPDGPPPGPLAPLGGRGPADMIARADRDGDGRVSRQEYLDTRAADVEAMFDRMDADGDGFLDEPEIARMAERLRAGAEAVGIQRPDGEPRRRPGGEPGFRRPEGRPQGGSEGRPEPPPLAGEAFDRMDRDGDGALSREEFLAGMAWLREMRGGEMRGPEMRRPPGGPRPGMTRPGGRRGPDEGFRRPPRQEPAAD